MSDRKRTYRMRRRADSQERTRQRIVESAVALHEKAGPSRTSMAAVAEHAGVQRSTLYRHFPDEESLYAACSAHWYAGHAPPDVESWRAIADPDERLVAGLTELYGWYRGTGTMLDVLIRDEDLVPVVKQRFVGFHARLALAREILLAGRGVRGAGRVRVAAALALALRFETWREVCREGRLEDAEAAELLAALVASAATVEPSPTATSAA
jgi:AcrR family transcriptional regulator